MPAIQQEVVTVVGELVSWRAFTDDGWGVGEVERANAERVGVTGKLVGLRVGDSVELQGVWTQHARYGRQLKVRACTATRPESTDGIIKWLASTLPDVGEGRARKLVEAFGAGLWDEIEHRHQALTRIEGITPERASAIHDAYLEHKAERDNMIALRGWGLTDSQIARCVGQWRTLSEVVARIRANPYDLCQHVYGFGFLRADKVATKSGLPHDAPERIRAGVEYVLEEASGEGHCYMSGGALQSMAVKLLGVEPGLVAKGIRAAADGGRLVRRTWRIYTRRMDVAEQQCADALKKLLARSVA